MSKQLISFDGKYYFVDEDTLDIIEVHLDKPLLDIKQQKEILKVYIKDNK
ncbi:hypothetical protein FACS1894190_17730 [Spirochaetia bacterium]|nr:hypothetical protein FACS1894190_17730 [Spirochaetia bacterium]